MAQEARLTARQWAVLIAVVERYIDNGEPVGSATIAALLAGVSAGASAAGASAATVRNEMAALTDAGLLEQPHTSAGRVPSAQAFRMYVDHISSNSSTRDVERSVTRTGARLSGLSRAQVESQIDSSFAGLAGSRELLERTSHVLATLSSGVGVAVTAAAMGDLLEHVHFSRLAEKRVLAVLVTRGGMVRDRVLALDRDLQTRELETAANFLNEHFRGWNIERVRTELARKLETERSEYQRLMTDADDLWSRTIPQGGQALFVDGVANLIGIREDRGRLREMLTALEAKQRMIELLNAYVDARQESVRVVFDLEEQAPEMAGLVLIAAPAHVAGERVATVGVLGPQRMHYESAMNAVSYIAQMFERMSEPRQQ